MAEQPAPATDEGSLLALDGAIADAESRADRAFFEAVLHERFVMRRPSGRVDGRRELLDGLAAGATRRATGQRLVARGTHHAVVTCEVAKWQGGPDDEPAEPDRFANLRTWLLEPEHGWQLLSWLTEPAQRPTL